MWLNIWRINFHVIETWKFRTADEKYLEMFKIWCWRRMEKISWTDNVRNEVLLRVKEGGDILQTIKLRKANWIGHILHRECILKHVTKGKMEEKLEVI